MLKLFKKADLLMQKLVDDEGVSDDCAESTIAEAWVSGGPKARMMPWSIMRHLALMVGGNVESSIDCPIILSVHTASSFMGLLYS